MDNNNKGNRAGLWRRSLLTAALGFAAIQPAQAVELNENCVINILNRTVQVRPDGGWALPNVPSNMGQIRARATCTLPDGTTVTGQSDYFNIVRNGVTRAGDIHFETVDPVPTRLSFNGSETIELKEKGQGYQLNVTAFYADFSVKDVTAATSGINYSSTNPAVATVSADGVVSAVTNGVVLINARKDGVLVSRRVAVLLGGDLDGDGLPDDWERANNLNPNDPVDALEDHDKDGLTALQEFQLGSDIYNADTDGDGISDKEESEPGADGVVTSPILADTDGDGISDGLEIAGGSDPNDANSGNLVDFLDFLEVRPGNLLLTYNAIDGESSSQLAVTGVMIDGSTIDLTSQSTGTRYQTDNIRVASFGVEDGEIFAGENGQTKITISNNGKQIVVDVEVSEFTPQAQAALAIPGYANNVDLAGETAFVAAGSQGLQVVDYSTIEQPKIIGSLDTSGTAIDVKVSGNYAYIADGGSGLQIMDVSDPAKPVLVSTTKTSGIAQDLALQNEFVFIADGDAGIEILNAANVQNPFTVGATDALKGVKGIAVENDYMVAVGGSALSLFSIENKAAPLRLYTVNIGPVQDVAIENGYVYVAAYSSGYRVYRITEQNTLELKGGDRTFVPRDVAVTNGFAFFAEQLFPNVVAYLNIKNPEQPFFQDTIDLSPLGDYAGTGLALTATHAFVTEEAFVVGRDYGSDGNTKLFSAQYRMLTDNNGIAPTINFTKPADNTITVEGARLMLTAEAEDDIAVKKVEFYANNYKVAEDTTAPYQVPYSVPYDINTMVLSAKAIDLGGNTTSTPMIKLEVQKDSDKDGLGNEQETGTYNTDPEKEDTDGDGLLDGEEVARGTDPNKGDTDGDGLLDGAEVENDTDPTNPDTTAPVIVTTEPADAETDVAENAVIIITFDEILRKKSISSASIVVKENGTTAVAGGVSLLGEGEQLMFRPGQLLKDYTPYTVTVFNVKDSAGNPLAEQLEFSFETGDTVDTVRPTVSSLTPVHNSVDIPVNAAVNLIMSERIDPASVTAESFYITDTSTNERIDGLVEVRADSQTISFIPNVAFLIGRKHQITLKNTVRDLFGNAMGSDRNYYFTTAFVADGVAPVIAATSFPDGQAEVPVNAPVVVKMSESIDAYSIRNLKLVQNGVEVPSNVTLSSDATTITVKPIAPFEANTAYTLLIDQLADLSGNLLAVPYEVNFLTASASDTSAGSILGYSPRNYAEVAANSKFTIDFPEAVDATSLNGSTIRLLNDTQNRYINSSFTVSNNGRQVQLTADELVVGDRYRVYISNVKDLAGNFFRAAGWYYFIVTQDADDAAPEVSVANFTDGISDLAVNTKLRLMFSEELGRHCVNNDNVKLMLDGQVVETSISLSSDRRQITISPSEHLQAGGNYQVVLSGLCDTADNTLNEQTMNFSVSGEGAVDTAYPRIQSITPENNSTDVAVTMPIVLTFDEVIDPTNSYDQIRIYAGSSSSGYIAGDFAFNGNVVTFTPANPYPGNTRINVSLNRVRDIVGNSACCWNYAFTTESQFDNAAPIVTSVTPAGGAMDVGVNVPIVLTFDESLNAATVNNTNFKLYNNGNFITPSVYRSKDSRTVTLRGTWPAGATMSVLITDDVTDLSGNKMADYASIFSTAVVDTDANRPSVIRQYPPSGATNVTNVDAITIFTNELMDENTLWDAFHVAQNGVLMQGQVTLGSSGQAVSFRPDTPFEANALIHVYLDSNAKDDSGNAMNYYAGTFRTQGNNGVGTRPTPTTYIPSNGSKDVAVNSTIQIAYNQPIDEAFVTEQYINLRQDGGDIIPTTLTQSEDKKVITLTPGSNLAIDTYYYVSMSYQIQDTDGENQRYNRSFGFTTGSVELPDTQRPVVVAMSPAAGSVNVPINPQHRVRFDEPMNPLSFEIESSMDVAFSADQQEVAYLRYAPLLENTEYKEILPGIKDMAGNDVVAYDQSYTTGELADITRPNWQSYLPESNTTVAINSPVVWVMNEVVDAITVNNTNVYVQDTSQSGWPIVPGSVSLAADGRTITWTADGALPVGRRMYAVLRDVSDLSGNINSNDTFYFYSALNPDSEAPKIVATSVTNGYVEVATNARIRVRFDEPVNKQKLGGVTLTHAGGTHPVRFELSSDRKVLSLIPVALLPGETLMTLNISGIEDMSGNQSVATTIDFTTAIGPDTFAQNLVSFSPTNYGKIGTNGVLTAAYGERIDSVSVTGSTFRVHGQKQNRDISGEYRFIDGGKTVQFIPDQWVVGERYQVYLSNIRDLSGNTFSAKGWYYADVLETADNDAPQVLASNIIDGMSELAINTPIRLGFDEPLAAHCVNGDTVQLLVNGEVVEAAVQLSNDRRLITILPSEHLAAGTTYQVVADGLCDTSGNSLSQYSYSFSTSADATVDTSYPRIQSITPANGSSDIDINSNIVFTFDEAIDPTNTLSQFRITTGGSSNYIAGDFDFNGNIVTFTPLNPLPGNARIDISLNRVRDIVGNAACCWNYSFVTTAVFDEQAPQVAGITPNDGAMDIGINTPVVLTFDESLNGGTVNNSNFKLYSDGNLINPSVHRSADNRTVTLTGTWPAGQTVSVVVTNDVKDLSNNHMVDYVSVFSTAAIDNDNSRPQVTRQYPSNGATNVTGIDTVSLYTSELMDAATVADAFHVAENGVLKPGQVTLASSGQVVIFTPDTPFADHALIHVYLDNSAKDDSGNAVNDYQGTFRTGGASVAGTQPDAISYVPRNGSQDVALNPVIEVAYNEALDEAYVNASYISLKANNSTVVGTQISLLESKKVIRIVPDALLAPATPYTVSLSYQILDIDGDRQRYNRSFSFTTGEAAVEDTQRPMVVTLSPNSSSQNVATNPTYRVRFDEPINPHSSMGETNISLSFSSDNRTLAYSRFVPLPANTEHTETISGFADISGNEVVARSETFTTGEFADVTRPNWASYVPDNNATVAINTPVVWVMNEVIDGLTVNDSTVYVQDTSISGWPRIPGSASLAADGKTITWVPDAPWPVGRRMYAYLAGVSDLSGNANSNDAFYFYTSLEADTVSPVVLMTSVVEGSTQVATNSRIRIRFNEAVNKQLLTGVTLSSGGTVYPVRYELNSNRTELTLIPRDMLPANTTVTLTIDGIRDLSGNALTASSLSFTTEAGADIAAGSMLSYSPYNYAYVSKNARVSIVFSERVDPVSISRSTFRVHSPLKSEDISGRYEFSADGKSVTFIADSLEPGVRYQMYLTNIRDLAGNVFPAKGWYYFHVTETNDSEGPSYQQGNIVDGALDIAVNTPIRLQFSEELSVQCVNQDSVQLLVNGSVVDADIALNGDRTQITVTPAEQLAADTTYQIVTNGLCDIAGNPLAEQGTLTFTTSADATADTQYPRLQTITPQNGATDVPVGSAIVLTFDEPIDPTNDQSQIRVTAAGASGYVGGELSFDGAVVTFTPYQPMPGNTQINISLNRVRDIVGNASCCWNYSFTTESVFDTTAPEVAAITPADGAMDIGINTPIVLTFSESLNSSTVNGYNFKVYGNGQLVNPSVYLSLDGRTVTLRGTWPAGVTVSVIATNDVKDLSGNHLEDYVSVFSTSVPDGDKTRPSVVRQYPASGATNVSNVTKVTLYTSELLDESTVHGAMKVAQNGVVVSGQVTVDSNGQALIFTPDNPFEQNALINVYLESTAKDISGNPLNYYQGNFRMASSQTVGVRPTPTLYVPHSGATGVAVNPQIQVAFNQAIDPEFVTENYISLRQNGGAIVAATLTQSDDKKLISIVPEALLSANTYYYVSLSYYLQDTDGEQQRNNRSFGFTTGADDVEDTQRPMVTSMTPGDNAVNVAVNPTYRVRFDEPVNPLSFSGETNMSVSFADDRQEVQYSRYVPLAANTEHTETIADVTDLAGNLVVEHSETFTTGESADVTRPKPESYLPDSNATVAVNTPVVWIMDEIIDPLSVNNANVYVQDTSQSGWPKVAGSVSLGDDGRTITWVADNEDGLLSDRRYYAWTGNIADLSGNTSSASAFYFYTSAALDNVAPTVQQVNIPQGLTNVPTNTRVRVRFSEGISKQKLKDVTLSSGGNTFKVRYELNSSRTELTLIPFSLLPSNTQITLTVDGVQDFAGNALIPSSSSFSTGSEVDTFADNSFNISPYNYEKVSQNGVMTATFGERVDAVSVNASTFRIYSQQQRKDISGSYSVSEDGTVVRFKPDELISGHRYQIYLSNIRDLAGNTFNSRGWYYFDVVAGEDNEAPAITLTNIAQGGTDIPVNAAVKVQFDSPVANSCINAQTVQLQLGGNVVETNLSLNNTRTLLTVTPKQHLTDGSSYNLKLSGICDVSENVTPDFNLGFDTRLIPEVDSSAPQVREITPEHNSVEQPTNSQITITFNEAIDPFFIGENASNSVIRVYTGSKYYEGQFEVMENVVRFTSDSPFPVSTKINIYLYNVRDIVGNRHCCSAMVFTTAAQ